MLTSRNSWSGIQVPIHYTSIPVNSIGGRQEDYLAFYAAFLPDPEFQMLPYLLDVSQLSA